MAIFTLAATALLSAIGIVGASTFTVGLVAPTLGTSFVEYDPADIEPHR